MAKRMIAIALNALSEKHTASRNIRSPNMIWWYVLVPMLCMLNWNIFSRISSTGSSLFKTPLLSLLLISAPFFSAPLYSCTTTSPYLIFLVHAPHLDCTNGQTLFKTMCKHPRDLSKEGDVGHAWIYLSGCLNGQPVVIEGGHSGETGQLQPRYCEGIANYLEAGDPNPIRYLWSPLQDGFFQIGPGRHRPTLAAGMPLTQPQFEAIYTFIQNYAFQEYSLANRQCVTFIIEIARLAGIELDCWINVPFPPSLQLNNTSFPLWQSPCYSNLCLASPDMLEKALYRTIKEGRTVSMLHWYRRTHPQSLSQRLSRICSTLLNFPKRLQRRLMF